MAPEPSHRLHRQRSQPRSASRPRSPSRRPHRDARPSNSPTRERSDPDLRSRERHRHQDPPLRSKSRPPGSSRSSRDNRHSKRPRVRFSILEAEGAAQAMTAKASRCGMLRKQADNEPGAWNEYYFVLKPLTYLLYYNSKEDATPRGVIDLEYLTDIKRNADCLQRAVGGSDHCFRVSGKLPRPTAEQTAAGEVPKMRPLYLDTEDDEEAAKWMDAIRNHRFSVKKDEQFFEMVHELQDAKLRVAQLEEQQQREAEVKASLRMKSKTLLHRMRAVDSGNTEELPGVDVESLDDVADDMLAMLEGMEDVMVNLQAKLEQQKQEISQLKTDKAGTTNARRGFTQVLQRAVSRRENASFLELSEDEEEETLAAIRNRRQRKPKEQPSVVQLKEKEQPQETPQKKVREEPPVLDKVPDVLSMWKAKTKKKPSAAKQSAQDDDEESRRNRSRAMPRSVRSMTTALETGLAPRPVRKYTSVQRSRGSDRSSEEDTASLDSTDDRGSGETLPHGWTKHESRGYPGTYYYAHESGKVSWDAPTDNMARSGRDVHDDNQSEHDEHDDLDDSDAYNEDDVDIASSLDTSAEYLSENDTDGEVAGATTSAAYRKNKPRAKLAWGFKLPKLLPTASNQTAPTEAAAPLSPVKRDYKRDEF